MTNRPAERDRVVIVGGGVIGVCCAFFLAQRGAHVTVLERDAVGEGCSFGNAGAITPGHPPLNRPGLTRQALSFLLDPASPLYIAPRWDPALARWLAAFRRHCTHEHVERVLVVLGPLGRASRVLFDRLTAEEGLDCGYRADGYYEVCRTARGLAEAREAAALARRHGAEPRLMAAGELEEREPAFRRGLEGGVFYPEAAIVRPYDFVRELADRAARRGVTFRFGETVAEVLVSGGRARGVLTGRGESVDADAVVLATGAYSLDLMSRLGWHLPVQPGKGYHRDLPIGAGGAPALGIGCLLSETFVFCTPMNGSVRFAGTMEFSGVNHTLRRRRLEQLTRAAAAYLEGVGSGAPRSEWCGLRPVTPDGLPIVGPVPGCAGLHVATGHAMLGLTIGPITGQLVAECVLDGAPSLDIAALGVDRFARR